MFSPNYFLSEFAEAEWTAAFRLDPTGKNEKLIPVRIEDCQPPGLLGSIIYVDLVKLDEATARERLLAGLAMGRRKPSTGPKFPRAGDARLTASAAKPEFPRALPQYWNVPVRNRLFTGREDVLEKGARFLLRRARLLGRDLGPQSAPADQQAAARELSIKLDGLPLALDQAGAFIEETPSSPIEYLQLYAEVGAELRRIGKAEHESVHATFSLAFEKIRDASRAVSRSCTGMPFQRI